MVVPKARHLQAGDAASLFLTARALDAAGDREAARQAYIDVLAKDASHAGALARLGALLFAAGYTSAARTTYAHAVSMHPDDPSAHVNLGHLLRQSGQHDEALAQYNAALACDGACPEAHQGISYLLDGVDDGAAARHRDLGFDSRALTTESYRGRGKPIHVLRLVSARGGNIPTRHILDDRIFATHTLVVEYAGPQPVLPRHDVVFNTIGDADRCADALHLAAALLSGTRRKVLNTPRRVLPTTRAGVLQIAGALPGVVVPHAADLARSDFAGDIPAGFSLPFLLRTPGFHTGQHFSRVDAAEDLPALLAALPGDRVMALQYLDAAGRDGNFRKFRVMLIGGHILPLHLAISSCWKVHYFTAGMATNPQHRAEEARFLADMAGVLGPVPMNALCSIEAALGLDYAGVDFALDYEGRLLLFEANATMTLVPPGADAMWDYRRPSFERALAESRNALRN